MLGDPINPAFATWIKGELSSPFKVPVRQDIVARAAQPGHT
jgi:hypothetical protein